MPQQQVSPILKREQFAEVKGFATRVNAQRKLDKFLASMADPSVRWFILALPNGRFAPCVNLIGDRENSHLMAAFAHNGICVIG